MPKMRVGERRLVGRMVAVGCLLFFFYLALTTIKAKTLTNDEPAHILRAFAVAQVGDLQYQFEHAPLSHQIIGLFLFSDPDLPVVSELSLWGTNDRLQVAAQLLWDTSLDIDRTLFLTRLPVVFLGVILGALVGSWALAWHGRLAMITALVFFAASPNLIAHSALATTDLAAAATYFAAVYAWWLFWLRRQKRWWAITAVFLGLALATKLTAVLLLPVLLFQVLIMTFRGRDFWRSLLLWLGLLLPAGLLLWVVYGFETGPFDGWPIPLPAATYLQSWQSVLSHMDSGHQAFFLGELSTQGWWYYFPVTFLIKTPLVTLLLLLIAFVVIIRRRYLWQTAVFLLIPVSALFAAAMVSGLNIGYRHILPTLPFLLVLGSSAVLFLRQRRITQRLLGVGLAWVLIAAIWRHPHHLAYFNPAVGGMAQGYSYLGDSNLDWGQDLKLLTDTVLDGEGEWNVSYNGVSDPHYYGLPQEVLIDLENAWTKFAVANPPAGQYAISANHLQGLIADEDLFDWFRRQEPASNLGGSILIYEIREQAHGEWVAHCMDPAPLLTMVEAETLVGKDGLRHLVFDCRNSLLLPDEGSPGWFVLPQSEAWWFQELLHSEDLQLVYRHDAAVGTPSFDVYFWSGTDGFALSEDWKDQAMSLKGMPLTLPNNLNEFAGLVGYQVNGDQWLTLWQLNSGSQEPLSIQAHLYLTEDSPPQVGDGLGFSSDQWRDGDLLVQRHEFPGFENGEFMETGIYDFVRVEGIGESVRLPVE